MEPEDGAQHPTGGKRLVVAVEPPKPLDQMTPEERKQFFGKVFDKAQDNRPDTLPEVPPSDPASGGVVHF